MAKRKDPAAVALGRKGGVKRVAKGFSMMSPERRLEIARAAAAKRWAEKKRLSGLVAQRKRSAPVR
jgi:hypothetical protein